MSDLPWRDHYLRGIAAASAGSWQAASEALREALDGAAAPADAAAVCNDLATAYIRLGELDQGLATFQRGLELHPENGRLWLNLASSLMRSGRLVEAIPAARRAAQSSLEPEVTFRALRFLSGFGVFSDAADGYRRLIECDGETAALWTALGTALYACGRIEEGAEAYRRAIDLDGSFAPALSNRLFAMHLHPLTPPESIADAHFAWGRAEAATVQPCFAFGSTDRTPQRPLRIGILSSDLRAHSIVYFLAPILGNLDGRRFPLTIFSNVSSPDGTTARLKSGTHRWLEIQSLSAVESAELIHRERIDILLEVGGHTSPKTLAVLARKPAPVQIAYLAYPDTTGLTTVDYVLTDAIADPPGASEHLYSEQLLRIDPCGLCYEPPHGCPDVKPRDAGAPVVFGSFAQRQKLSPRTLSLWVSILRRAPGSLLLLKAKAWSDPRLCAEIREWFACHGVDPARIELVAHIETTTGHLDLYNSVDICLDTFPYSGITTTCEALWMGVPVIALPGRNQVSRLCASILHAAGRPDLVAAGDMEYVEKALDLARDVSMLRRERRSFRQRLAETALLNGPAFTRRIEQAFANAWQDWLARL